MYIQDFDDHGQWAPVVTIGLNCGYFPSSHGLIDPFLFLSQLTRDVKRFFPGPSVILRDEANQSICKRRFGFGNEQNDDDDSRLARLIVQSTIRGSRQTNKSSEIGGDETPRTNDRSPCRRMTTLRMTTTTTREQVLGYRTEGHTHTQAPNGGKIQWKAQGNIIPIGRNRIPIHTSLLLTSPIIALGSLTNPVAKTHFKFFCFVLVA